MKKDFEKYFLYGVLVIALGGLVLAFSGFSFNGADVKTTNKVVISTAEESGFKLISSGSTGPGDVSVDLKPHEVKDGKLEVDISVNTHSVDLNQFDLKEITTLEFDGKTIAPVSAPTLSGHHNSGTLTFEISEKIDTFTIKIIGIPKVEERIFEWR